MNKLRLFLMICGISERIVKERKSRVRLEKRKLKQTGFVVGWWHWKSWKPEFELILDRCCKAVHSVFTFGSWPEDR